VPPTIAATGIPAPAIVPTPAPSTKLTQDTSKGNIYKAVHVNEDMVDMFNKFLTEQHPNDYQNYLFDFNSLDFSDVESIRNSWYKYIYGSDYMASSGTDTSINKLASDSLQLLAKADSLRADSIAMSITKARKDSLTLAQQSKSKGIKGKSKKGKKAKEVSAPSVTSAELMASAPSTNRKRTKPTTGSTESYKFKARQFDTIEIITKGFTYQVQIAACRSQLSKSYLNAIYKGPEIPIETFENNWYKYSVGSFLSYRSAKKFRDNCSVNGAFVVAFCNGRKININDALIARKSIDKIPTAIIDNKIPLQFRIQIAASKTELTVAEVRYIYDSVENIEMIMENEWYKYSLPSGTDYQDARHIVKNINVKGAFVTAYSYGNKISLHEAFKMMQSK
jgi:hypothetical protein